MFFAIANRKKKAVLDAMVEDMNNMRLIPLKKLLPKGKTKFVIKEVILIIIAYTYIVLSVLHYF
jgi:hypothetical protein